MRICKGKTMCVLCTNDSILAGPDATEIDDVAKQMADAKLAVTEEGNLNDFLGANIDRKSACDPHVPTTPDQTDSEGAAT